MPDDRPPSFDLLRACFWLLAVVIGVALFGLLISAGACVVGVLSGRFPAGTCINLGLPQILHDWWIEMLTAILALLAARGPGRPPDPPPSSPE